MKKLVVNEDTCIACGACMQIDEEHFDFSSKGLSMPISQENLDSEKLNQAIDSCPVAAISIIDSDEDESFTTLEETKEVCECSGKCENCNCHNEEI